MKCALVTGGSRGIGKAVCIKMAALGYHVLINYKTNETAAAITLAQILQNGGTGELLAFNVSDKNETRHVLESWIENNNEKYIEVLVNNAGIKDDVLMAWMKDEQWENVIETNLNSFFYITRLVVTSMLEKKYGRIINIVSLSGLKGVAGQVNYSAAKAGIIGATKSLAIETGRYGITVNAVAPGFIKTDMLEGVDEKQLEKLIPVKRFGMPEEVAHAVGFLASHEAAYITGTVLSIDGGLH
jgi:3-oxoacyl-[acyl-carrier protein] reductase